MNDNYLQTFNDSFQRCTNDPEFLERFYEKFISCSTEIKKMFTNTNMKKQKKILLKSMAFMMHANHSPEALTKTAENHDKHHLNIKPELYILWLDSMIEAVKLTDPYFSNEVELAWRVTMQPGIDCMVRQYHRS